MTSRYDSTYVSAHDGDEPRPLQLPALPELSYVDVDAGKLFGSTPIKTQRNTDPQTEATAFLLKYSGLTAILMILALGLTWRLQWHVSLGVIAFAGMAIAGYWFLAALDHSYTGAGVERHRLSLGASVLRRQIDAERDVRLAQIELQASQVEAQREANAMLQQRAIAKAARQVEAHSAPQSHSNRLATYQDPQPVRRDPSEALRASPAVWRVDELEPPAYAYRDDAREAALNFIVSCYERDATGVYLRIDDNGYIDRHEVIPWGKRGGYSKAQRQRMQQLLSDSHVCRFDSNVRLWRLNLDSFADADDALAALEQIPTLMG